MQLLQISQVFYQSLRRISWNPVQHSLWDQKSQMKILYLLVTYVNRLDIVRGCRRGRDLMVVWFTTTYAINAYHPTTYHYHYIFYCSIIKSWIWHYLCNQCLSPLKLWVRISFIARCTWYDICDKVCRWFAARLIFSGYSGFFHQ